MKYHTFFKIESTNDLDFIVKKIKKMDLRMILKGLFQKKKYFYYPELDMIINQYNEKEFYFLERSKKHG